MGKDPRVSADKNNERAKVYLDTGQFKKAAKAYYSAALNYLKINDYLPARDSFFGAAKAFNKSQKFDEALEAMRNSADTALLLDDYSTAQRLFKNALKFVSEFKKDADRDSLYILLSSLSYLCFFIQGKQEIGLQQVKEIKKEVSHEYFKDNPLVRLVKNLTIAIRDNNKSYLEKVEEEFPKYKFRDAEAKLVKEVLVLAKSHVSIKTELTLDKHQYTTKELIKVSLSIDTTPLIEISNYPFHNYTIKEFKISNVGLTLSDNLAPQKKLDLPIVLKPGQKEVYEMTVKPHFQKDGSFIGPILFTCEIDNKFIFFLKTQSVIPNLISPPPSLTLEVKNLKTPLVDQTHPMEIVFENDSEGEALDLNIEVQFPEKLKLIRGTTSKQIYSLRSKENIKWELSVKPLDVGDHEIKFNIKFKDPDDNEIEEVKNYVLSIQM